MTTMTVGALAVNYSFDPVTGIDTVSSLETGQFAVVFADGDSSINYTITDTTPEGVPSVDIQGSDPYNLRFNGVNFTAEGSDDIIMQVTTSSGSHIVMVLYDQTTNTDYFIPLGGDPLPAINSAADFEAFEQSVTGFGPATGIFAPGVNIPFSSFSGATITENDVIHGGFGDDTLLGGAGYDNLHGHDGNDSLVGGTGDNEFFGGAGDDTMVGNSNPDNFNYVGYYGGATGVNVNLTTGVATDGLGGTDTLIDINEVGGTEFDDTLIGTSGDNYFNGYGGDDIIDGGAGTFDQVNYRSASSGINVNLATGVAQDGDGGTDTLTGIEVVRGSHFDDTITGDSARNVFRGIEGDDTMDGAGGNDEVRYDRDDRYGGTSGVTVNLATGTATDGFGDTDTLINIEDVRGSRHADMITGDGNDNRLRGDDGDDTLIGGGGDDDLEGGAGNDSLVGGEGYNYFQGGAGDDTIVGGTEDYQQASYAYASSAINANLTTGTVQDGDGGTDTLVDITVIRGSAHDDVVTGNDQQNWFYGLAGDDTIDGGSSGSDEARYDRDERYGGSAGVTVNLTTGTATDGFGDTDTLIGIERVRGTAQADHITGNASDNRLEGNGGNDTIDGAGGNNTVRIRANSTDATITTINGTTTVVIGGDTLTLTNIADIDFDDMTVDLAVATPSNTPPVATLEDVTLAAGTWSNIGAEISTSDVDSGDTVATYRLVDATGANNLWLGGVGYIDASSGYIITADQISELWLQGDTASGTQTLEISAANDDGVYGPTDNFVLTSFTPNTAPTVTTEDLRVMPSQSATFADAVTFADADSDAATMYEVWDDNGSNSFVLDGQTIDATSGAQLTAAEFARLQVNGDASDGTQTLWVRASDGTDWSGWTSLTLETTANTNTAPTLAVDDVAVAANASTGLAALLQYADADSDAATQYEIWDDQGGNSFHLNGTAVNATSGYTLSAADLANLTIVGDNTNGAQTLWVRASDGTDWSSWANFSFTTGASNTAPVATVDDLSAGLSAAVSVPVNYSDADSDPAAQYEIWDDQGGNSFHLNGTAIDATGGYTLNAADLANLTLVGDSSVGVQTLWIRANDGSEWGGWDAFEFTSGVINNAPVATIDDQAIALNGSVAVSSILSYSDADSDAATQYEIWDDQGGNSFLLNGTAVDASSGYTLSAADLANLTLVGDAADGTQTLWIRASDGADWSTWDSFDLSSGTVNAAPTVVAEDITVDLGTSISDFLSEIQITDPENDTITQIEVWDDDSIDSFVLNGTAVDASAGYVIDLTGMNTVGLNADITPGAQTLWVRANDGTNWSAWESFTFDSVDLSAFQEDQFIF